MLPELRFERRVSLSDPLCPIVGTRLRRDPNRRVKGQALVLFGGRGPLGGIAQVAALRRRPARLTRTLFRPGWFLDVARASGHHRDLRSGARRSLIASRPRRRTSLALLRSTRSSEPMAAWNGRTSIFAVFRLISGRSFDSYRGATGAAGPGGPCRRTPRPPRTARPGRRCRSASRRCRLRARRGRSVRCPGDGFPTRRISGCPRRLGYRVDEAARVAKKGDEMAIAGIVRLRKIVGIAREARHAPPTIRSNPVTIRLRIS